MAWIESHTVLIRHRKLRAMAADLRIKPVYLVGHLHALWHTALEQQEDGDLSAWSDHLIADAAAFPGDASKFVSLLRSHRWFGYSDEAGNLIPGTEKLIHDWIDYAGRFLTSKYSTSSPGRLAGIWAKHRRIYGRSGKACEQREESERKATTPTHPTNPPNPTHPTKPYPPTGEGLGGVCCAGAGKGNGRECHGPMSDAMRQIQVQAMLAGWGVSPESQRVLSGRVDVTPVRLEAEWARINADPGVNDRAALLVHKLTHRKSKQ